MQTYCEYVDTSDPENVKVLEEEHDIKQIPLSDSDLKEARAKFENVYDEWAERLEKRGLPARKVIEGMQ